ncbi:tRNA(Phe) 7-((3-amino-3-carboxypropyl)-4-demethylwyosine(37)-N(4))-methyltransferase [Staphylothermus hellenicus]|uniref:tRNA(Phe) 7-((3-amino-3-carboxypropyl)-4-demethylwyosine(37)-N(4))-methyltransferase n=1 Tax=Staphylothermus hellenicus (strain DSM 12710 / JCM 10830 / BK20S6-10-b1 / P8) TaxID=591019 RepID=D7DBE4_STAHD|nr:hypothetical protein [Staphylothermus hellenicus]ADI31491.1 Protein of unknown function DUF207 [Staphylothermus hellenicus DSM 12710]
MSFKINLSAWQRRKTEFWNRLWEDLEIGYLDEDLIGILLILNSDKNIYTLSSCSGRITISDSTYPWSREESSVVFKKHIPITINEILDILKKPVVRRLWLNSTGPILHLSTNSLEYADKILSLARKAGLKHSGIISMNPDKGYIIELTSGVKVSHLLRSRGILLAEEDSLREIVDVANEVLLEGKKVLIRMFKVFRSELPWNPDNNIVSDLKNRGINIDKYDPYKIYGKIIRLDNT